MAYRNRDANPSLFCVVCVFNELAENLEQNDQAGG
jgi:hypothetical protein